MSCKISRRNFMRCVGIGTLALASASLLGGCTRFDAEYGMNEVVSWGDGTFTMAITQAYLITASSHSDMAVDYQLYTDDGQRYVYLLLELENGTGEDIVLYKRRGITLFSREYTDEVIREYFYVMEEDDEQKSTYPNANQMVDAPTVLWAYNNGMYLNDGNFGVVCYTGLAGEPREETTYAKIPQGKSYITCIGQITENLQTFRLVYRRSNKEVNFVLSVSDFT